MPTSKLATDPVGTVDCGFRAVRPYTTYAGALAALDNGGRFWNVLSHAGDGRISGGELAKAARTLQGEARALTYFELAIAELSDDERARLRAALEPSMRGRLALRGPSFDSPAAAARRASGKAVITSGEPRYVAEVEILRTAMMMVGKVFVPITQRLPHALYELVDASERGGAVRFVVSRGRARWDARCSRIGALMAEQRVVHAGASGEAHEKLLVAWYHTPLERT